MVNKETIIHIGLFALIVGLTLLFGAYVIPWNQTNWGTVSIQPAGTVTVTGTAKTQTKSQIAQFSAGINVVKDSKDDAISEANKKISDIIEAVKAFGVPSADIKTQNLSVYQAEETYWEDGRQKSRPGQWRVGNTIEIKLKDADKASDLADVLTQSGATNIYGPNFTLDDTDKAETELLDKALENARQKADLIAKSSGRNLGKTLMVNEGQGYPISIPYFSGEGRGGGGAPAEPGSGTVQKNINVTFELK